MRTIKLMDMTLRETGIIRDSVLSFKEKLEIARVLDRLKVDAIELAPIYGQKADELANKTIASMVATGVCAAVDISTGNVEETWESIRNARSPRLNLIAPVSPVQMEYTCHKKAPAMLQEIENQIKQCRFYCENVEFTAADASRAEKDFLAEAIEKAVSCGARAVTLCDTAGILFPDEWVSFIDDLNELAPSLKNAELYVQVNNNMDMGTACAAFAIRHGAAGVKCTAVPSEYPSLTQIASFIKTRGLELSIAAGIRVTELERATTQLAWMLKPQEKTESPLGNIGIGETPNVSLDQNDSIEEVVKVVRQLGYDLSEEDNARVYEAFRRVAVKKHFVGTKELDVIVASTAMQVPAAYRIENYVINSGNVITATANILLDKNGEKVRGVAVGDGPIDAAFLAIEQIIGHHYELDDFQIQTVTEGRDAMGSALVKLRSGGRIYSGSGISTDIIGASIRAYISALNKIVYEEG